MDGRFGIGAVVLLLGAGALAGPESREFTFQSPKGPAHPAILTVPDAAARNGISVLMIGGGAAWDEHWTTPGSYTIDGKTTAVTIDGKEHRDGDTIAAALAARGFIVMQWGAVHADDEKAKENPALAMGLPYDYSVELTRTALRVLREQPGVDPRRIALVGHSLGATRACQVADDGVVAMAFLAGAYLSLADAPPRQIAADTMADLPGLDADGNGEVEPAEFEAWRGTTAPMPAWAALDVDRDGDGVLRPWEIAAAVWMARADAGDRSLRPDKPDLRGGPWPSEVIARGTFPVLAIYGGLDDTSFHGPWLQRQAAGLPARTIEVAYFKALGHQLSPEQGGLIGAIDPAVVERLAGWLAERTEPATE